MNTIKKTTFQRGRIQIDPNQVSKTVELYDLVSKRKNLGLVVRKPSTSPSVCTEFLIKYIRSGYAPELFMKQSSDTDTDTSSSFVNIRQQEPFDWVRTISAYQRITHLAKLEDKWDGYNAPKFTKAQIEQALNLYSTIITYSINRGLSRSKVEPFIAPASDGTILFEWAGKRFPVRQLEIYVSSETVPNFEYFKIEGDFEEENQLNLDRLYLILDWLFKFDG